MVAASVAGAAPFLSLVATTPPSRAPTRSYAVASAGTVVSLSCSASWLPSVSTSDFCAGSRSSSADGVLRDQAGARETDLAGQGGQLVVRHPGIRTRATDRPASSSPS